MWAQRLPPAPSSIPKASSQRRPLWKGGYFKETGGIRGDANGDGEVSLIDVMITVEYYLGNNPQDFIFTNAEMDDDDEISLSDLLGIVDIILNQ